jgi:hypothetical protein
MSKSKRGFSTTTYLKDDLELDTQVTLNGVQDDDIVLVWSIREIRMLRAVDGEFVHEPIKYQHLEIFRDMFQDLMDELK